MNLRRSALGLIAVITGLCVSGATADADGVVRDSVGATSSGRGGANIAHSDNGAIILSNPAAIVNTPTTEMADFSIDTVLTDLRYADPENDKSAKIRPYALPEFSYIRRSQDGRYAWGIGTFVPAGFGATWDLRNPVLGRRGYKTFSSLAKILPSAAIKLTDKLSVGATLGVAINHAELESPFFLQTGPLAGAPARLDLQGTGATPTWSLGMQYQLSDRTTIGASYISETRFKLKGRGTADVFLAPGAPPLTSRFDTQIDLDWPRSFGLGIAHQINHQHRVSLDVLYFDWSSAFDRLDLKFTNPSNPAFRVFGPKIRDSLVLHWKDSISVRTGYEYFATPNDVIRAGYVFNSETIPSSTVTPLLPATLEHTFSLGYGKSVNNHRFDIAYQYAFGPTRRVGKSQVVGGDFDFSKTRSQTHWIFLGYTKFF